MPDTTFAAAEAATSYGRLGAPTIGSYLDSQSRPELHQPSGPPADEMASDAGSLRDPGGRFSRRAAPLVGFTVEVRQDGSDVSLVPLGELDLASIGVLRAEIERLRAESCPFVLDLRELSFIDSAGLHLAADEAAVGNLTVVTGDGRIRRAFEVAGLLHVVSDARGSA